MAVSVNDTLCNVVTSDFDHACNCDRKCVPAKAVMFFCDGTYGISHQTDNDQCEWSPCSPAGEQIEESHADSAGDRTTFLTQNNGADKKRYVSEMDQSAVCSAGFFKAHKSRRL